MKKLLAVCLSLLALLEAGPVLGQTVPYFPPPGMAYTASNGNLTLQNLTLQSVTGIVVCDASAGLCSAANAASVIGLWTGTPSSTMVLGSQGALVALPAGVTFANPSATVGLSAVNGSALTAMRSDASPPLNTGISPTLSGTWTFANPGDSTTLFKTTNAADFAQIEIAGATLATVGMCASDTAATCQTNEAAGDSNLFFTHILHISTAAGADSVTIDAAGKVIVDPAGSGASLNVNGPVGNNALDVNGSSASGQSFGVNITAGTTSADDSIVIESQAGVQVFKGFGDGGFVVGASGADCGLGCLNVNKLEVGGTQPLGAVSLVLTSNGASAPTVNACNRCSSPSAARASAGIWQINTGVTLSSMVALCNISSTGPTSGTALFVYPAAANPNSTSLQVVFENTVGTATDPASTVIVNCAVGQ